MMRQIERATETSAYRATIWVGSRDNLGGGLILQWSGSEYRNVRP